MISDKIGKADTAVRKREFAPEPKVTATRLFERPGPELVICLHRENGFHMGAIRTLQIWSHQNPPATALLSGHPDFARVTSSWPDLETAENHFRRIVTMTEWANLSFHTVKADTAESPDPRFYGFDEIPIPRVSVEAASNAVGAFPLEPFHRLDPDMRRNQQTPVVPLKANRG